MRLHARFHSTRMRTPISRALAPHSIVLSPSNVPHAAIGIQTVNVMNTVVQRRINACMFAAGGCLTRSSRNKVVVLFTVVFTYLCCLLELVANK